MSTQPKQTDISPPPNVDDPNFGEGTILKDIDERDGVADSIAATVIVLVFVALSIYWIWSQGQLD